MAGRISKSKRDRVYKKTGGVCAYCGADIDKNGDWHIEHVIPKSDNGNNDISNLLPSCRLCNQEKYSRNIGEYRALLHEKLVEPLLAVCYTIDRHRKNIENERLDEAIHLLSVSIEILAKSEITFEIDRIGGEQ